MTLDEARKEAARWTLGPDVEVVVSPTWVGKDRGFSEEFVDLGLIHSMICSNTGKRLFNFCNTEVQSLDRLSPAEIRDTLERCWMKFAQHELKEHLRLDGERVYLPHGDPVSLAHRREVVPK